MGPSGSFVVRAAALAAALLITGVAQAESYLEVIITMVPDGTYTIATESNKEGASSCTLTTPAGSYGCSFSGDGFEPDDPFGADHSGLSWAQVESRIGTGAGTDWTLTWDASQGTETVASIDFGVVTEAEIPLRPSITSPADGSNALPNITVIWDYGGVPPLTAQTGFVEAEIAGPNDTECSSEAGIPATDSSWSPASEPTCPTPLPLGAWQALVANVKSIRIIAAGAGEGVSVSGDAWLLDNNAWLDVEGIDLSAFTVAASGSFTAVSYNVAALPAFLACCDPDNSIPIIAGRITPDEYDLVAYQEAFVHSNDVLGVGTLYYDTLMGSSTPIPYAFPPADPALGGPETNTVGSGLGKVSVLEFDRSGNLLACEDVQNVESKYCRQRWDMLTGNDAISSKGYSFSRHELSPSVFLDVYNWHAQAGGSNFVERNDNIDQLIDAINSRSEGNAVLVLGDGNATYDRTDDQIRRMLTDTIGNGGQDDPLVDVWVEVVRGQLGLPTQGGTALFPCDEAGSASQPRSEWAGPNCEWRDKIFYRGSADLTLSASEYFVEIDYLNPSNDADLSDHYPTGAVFDYTLVPEPAGSAMTALFSLAWLARRRRTRERDGGR